MKKHTSFLTLLLTIMGLFVVSVGSVNASPLPMAEEKQFAAENATWYVSTGGDDSNDCLSPSTACANIFGVLAKAVFLAGDTILVEQGEYSDVASYTLMVEITQSVNILGGWDANFSQQVGYSTWNGQTTHSGFYITGGVVLLDAIEVTNALYGIHLNSGVILTLTNSSIHNNGSDTVLGAALAAYSDTQINIQNSLLYDNNAYRGGAIYTDYATSLFIENSAIFNNSATYHGGGLYLSHLENAEIINTTISSNTAANDGGGISTWISGNMTLRNVTIALNRASTGGGLDNDSDSITMSNTVIGNNYAENYGPDCYGYMDYIQSEGYNLIENTTDCPFTASTGDLLGIDPGLAALNANHVHPLHAYSPLLDAGDPDTPGSSVAACTGTDQIGTTRPIDGDGDGTARCDIGAFESGPLEPSVLTSIEVLSGSGQSANILTAYSQPLQVVALDNNNLPLPGVQIDFQAPNQNSISATFDYKGPIVFSTTTDFNGIAEAPTLYANNLPGQFIVTASNPVLGTSIDFNLENTSMFWYVSTSGDDVNDCLSVNTACASIQAVLSKNEFMAGDTIAVEQGEYRGANENNNMVEINQSVNILGGWDPSFSQQTGYSTLDGEISNDGFYISEGIIHLDAIEIVNAHTGIYASVETILLITDSSFHDNGTEETYGAALSAHLDSQITVYDSVFHNNISNRGTLYISLAESFYMHNSAVINNTASDSGGGIYFYDVGEVELYNTTISSNTSELYGGGIYHAWGGKLSLRNVTIARNIAQRGGGITLGSGTFTISNSVIGTNQATMEGPDCRTMSSAIYSGGYNLIEDISDCDYSMAPSDITGSDPGLAALNADHVHPLQASSPLLDAGNPDTPGSSPIACTTTDQLGTPRPIDGDQDGLARCDIGAFESGPLEPSALVNIEVYGGSIQGANIYTSFTQTLKVVALDNNGLPIPGIQIDFQSPDPSGPSVFFDYQGPMTYTTTTNIDGIAETPLLFANDLTGRFIVTATTPDLGRTLRFFLKNDASFWYVSKSGADTNNCQTSNSACASITGVFAKPQFTEGDTILVEQGEYAVFEDNDYTVEIAQSVHILGGWDTNFNQRIGYSTINGDPNFYGFTITQGSVRLDAIEVINASKGIGVYNGASVTVTKSSFHDNGNEDYYGGGFYASSGSKIAIYGSLFYNNISSRGSGLYAKDSTSIKIVDSAIVNNTSTYIGGGLFIDGGETLLVNSTISDNHAYSSGGGMYITGDFDGKFYNLTITRNSASHSGGVIVFNGEIFMANSVIGDNTAVLDDPDCTTSLTIFSSGGHNLVEDTTNCDFSAVATDMIGIDPGLAPLTSDYIHPLYYGSPLLDAGSTEVPDSSETACTKTDQLGTIRPIDGDGDGKAKCDIGAYESPYLEPSVLSSIEIHSGNNQTANIFDSYPEYLAVVAKDNNGLALPDIQIDFQTPDLSSPSATFGYYGPTHGSVITNLDGIAYTPLLVANEYPGIFSVTASTLALAGEVEFTLENLDGPYWYVSTTGNDTNDCLSPTNACATINGALTKTLFQAGDYIRVAEGLYPGEGLNGGYTVRVLENAFISGGWNENFTEQVGYSTIDGGNTMGGIFISGDKATLDSLEVINGISALTDGGGIYVAEDSNVTILNSSIHHNVASDNDEGGGIYTDTGVNILILKTAIYQNEADSGGGGIRVYGPKSFVIKDSAIFENTSSFNGGGILTSGGGHIEISDTTISSNILLGGSGGGLYASQPGDFTLKNVTIAYNSSDAGQALEIYSGELTLANTVVATNIGTSTNTDCTTEGYSTIYSEGFNLIGNITGCDIILLESDLTGIEAGLAPLNEDHVHPFYFGSPLFDAGNPAEPGSSEYSCAAKDQLGMLRPIDGDGDGEARCDIGAFESPSLDPSGLASIEIYSGDNQIANIFDTYSEYLAVIARDGNGYALSDIQIDFMAPDLSLPSATFGYDGPTQISVTTDANGIAYTPIMVANEHPGEFTVTASTPGLSDELIFTLENLDGPYWYVSNTGDDGNDCLSPASACATISGALEKETFQDGDHIRVAEGVYGQVSIHRSVYVSGGWNADFTERLGYATIDGEGNSRGIYIGAANVTLDSLEVINGFTDFSDGAGIYISAEAGVTIINCIIHHNVASSLEYGGGILVNADSNVLIRDSLIYQNKATGGGGIRAYQPASLLIENSAITGNSRGGISIEGGGRVEITNTTISSNKLWDNDGAGLYIRNNYDVILNNATIAYNDAASGHAITINIGTITMSNSVVGNNFNNSLNSDCYTNALSEIISEGYNLIENTDYCEITLTTSDLAGIDPELAPLNDDYVHPLYFGSPLFDAGNPTEPGSGPFSCTTTDQLHTPRPVDSDSDGTARCDIGAFESYPVEPSVLTAIEIYSGDNQTANIFDTYTENLAVVARDNNGFALPDIQIDFQSSDLSEPSVTFGYEKPTQASTQTDLYGIAYSPLMVANQHPGVFTVTASNPSLTEHTEFTLENLDGPYWYVSTTGDDTNDCLSPVTTCATIDGALGKETFRAGDHIRVAEGLYPGEGLNGGYTVRVLENAFISGGWNENFTEKVGYSTIDGGGTMGGIFISGDKVTLDSLEVTNGYASGIDGGGGIFVREASKVTILNSLIHNNLTADNSEGGGVYFDYGAHVLIFNTLIYQNEATEKGGGIRADSPESFVIEKSAIFENTAGSNGGGINFNGSNQMRIVNTTISSNTITSGTGAAIWASIPIKPDDFILINVTIANNSGGYSGALTIPGGAIGLANTVIADNTASYASGDCSTNYSGEIESKGYNLIEDITGCEITLTESDMTGIDPGLAPLNAAYVHMLNYGSLLLDAGSPEIPGSSETACAKTDQLGTIRPIDGDGDGDARCDIGAFESEFISQPLPGEVTLISPSDTIGENTPTFEWNDIGNTTQYELLLEDSVGAEIFSLWYDTSAICSAGSCAATPDLFLNNGNYSWMVRGKNAAGEGPWSVGMLFSVENLPPGEVTPISPTGIITENSPTYEWTDIGDAIQYQLLIKDSVGTELFSMWYDTTVVCSNGNCAVTPALFLNNGDYGWTVQGANAAGEGPWSVEMLFLVVPLPPGEATLISPNGTITEQSPTYEWADVGDATQYQLVISKGVSQIFSDWYETSAICIDGTCSVTPGFFLDYDDYSWKVRGMNAGGEGPWSTEMPFSVVVPLPGEVTPIAPSGTITDNTPTYEWIDLEDVTGYLLVTTDLYGGVITSTVVSATFYCQEGICAVTPGVFLSYDDYSWTVKGINDAGEGPSSVALSFTIVPPPPGEATLITPSGMIGENVPTYEWMDVGDANQYQFLINDSIGAEIFSMWYDTTVVCSAGSCVVTPDLFLNNGDYSWTVQGANAAGEGPWSVEMPFTVANPLPGKASLIAPTGTITENAPTYSWNDLGNATWYKLVVLDNNSDVIISMWKSVAEICFVSVCSVTPNRVLGAGEYSWWVMGKNTIGEGPQSLSGNFAVLGRPDRPTLYAPQGTITDQSPAYSWEHVYSAEEYLLVVKNSDMVVVTRLLSNAGDICTADICEIDPGITLEAGSYTWQVLPKNSIGDGFWSIPEEFTIE